MIRKCLFILAGCASTTLLAASPTPQQQATTRQAQSLLSHLPLRFETNQGQFGPAIRYAARTSSFNLALTAHGASLLFPGSPPIDLSFDGASSSPAIQPQDPLDVPTDYLIGRRENWHVGVVNYTRVRYRALYPGVDLVFYGKENRLEYDFDLAPGADPAAIRLRFQGAGKLALSSGGDLVLETPAGRMIQERPVVYQQDAKGAGRHTLTGRYVLLADNVAGIQVDSYDRSRPLVVDPVITYSTLLGGGGNETMSNIIIRSNGWAYIGGSTAAGDWVQPSLDIPYDAGIDCFVLVLDTTNNYALKYFTYFGGSNDDTCNAIAVDAPGFIYLTGQTASTDLPMQGNELGGIYQGNTTQNAGAATTYSAFLSKLDPHFAGTGNSLVFSTYLSGTLGNDTATGLQVGNNGIAYLIGTTASADFPVTANAYAQSLYGPSDCFLAEVDTVNAIDLYSTFFGSELDDQGVAIALAPSGLLYFAANTDGTQFPVAGPAYSEFPFGNYDVILGAFDLTQSGVNSLVYSTYFGGSEIDEAEGIALDSKGRLIVTGYTVSNNFPITPLSAVQPENHGDGDAFVSLVDPTQPSSTFILYSTYLGGSNGEVGYGVTADSAGYLYVTGYTMSADFPIVNAVQPNWGGGVNLFVARINPALAGTSGIDYSTYIGLDNTIIGCCLAVEADGALLVGGTTEGYIPLLPGYTPFQANFGGGYTDDFLIEFSAPSTPVTTAQPTVSAAPPEIPRHDKPPIVVSPIRH